MSKEYRILIEENKSERIDKYLAKKNKNLSRSEIQQLIKLGKVTINNRKIKASQKIEKGDLINLEIPIEEPFELKKQELGLDIVYQDLDIIIINKPVNMVVHPAPGHKTNTLVNGILYEFDLRQEFKDQIRPGIVHRLDKDTSGLIVVAKNLFSYESLIKQFKNRTVKREYKALIYGKIKESEKIISFPIARSKYNRQKMSVQPDGREAITYIKTLKYYNNYSLVKLKLKTGRTHQIRVHMNYLNHPIVGDQLYSNGKNEFNLKHQFLHASTLGFYHPRSDNWVEFNSILPLEKIKILRNLNFKEKL